MPGSRSAHDARIAAALQQLPTFRRWEGRALCSRFEEMVEGMDDEQAVMTLVVHLLRRLGDGTSP
jgi:hypothetical protein